MRGDAIAVAGQQPERGQPLGETDRRVRKDGPYLGRELAFAVVAVEAPRLGHIGDVKRPQARGHATPLGQRMATKKSWATCSSANMRTASIIVSGTGSFRLVISHCSLPFYLRQVIHAFQRRKSDARSFPERTGRLEDALG